MKRVLLESVRKPNYYQYINDNGEFADSCIICGKRHAKQSIQLTTDGELVDEINEEVKNSQGLFPIGSTCLKNIFKNVNK